MRWGYLNASWHYLLGVCEYSNYGSFKVLKKPKRASRVFLRPKTNKWRLICVPIIHCSLRSLIGRGGVLVVRFCQYPFPFLQTIDDSTLAVLRYGEIIPISITDLPGDVIFILSMQWQSGSQPSSTNQLIFTSISLIFFNRSYQCCFPIRSIGIHAELFSLELFYWYSFWILTKFNNLCIGLFKILVFVFLF